MPKTGNGTTTDGIEPAGQKTTTPLVSVIIPAYNADTFIRATLGSAVHIRVSDYSSRPMQAWPRRAITGSGWPEAA
jgi:hypothetical protein